MSGKTLTVHLLALVGMGCGEPTETPGAQTLKRGEWIYSGEQSARLTAEICYRKSGAGKMYRVDACRDSNGFVAVRECYGVWDPALVPQIPECPKTLAVERFGK